MSSYTTQFLLDLQQRHYRQAYYEAKKGQNHEGQDDKQAQVQATHGEKQGDADHSAGAPAVQG